MQVNTLHNEREATNSDTIIGFRALSWVPWASRTNTAFVISYRLSAEIRAIWVCRMISEVQMRCYSGTMQRRINGLDEREREADMNQFDFMVLVGERGISTSVAV